MTSLTNVCPYLSLESQVFRSAAFSKRLGPRLGQPLSTSLKTLKSKRNNVNGRSRETVCAGIKEDQSSVSNGDSNVNIFANEDVVYLAKLGGGCVFGACLIKYGSLVFPAVTTPNLLFALLLVASPPLFALVLLSKASRS